MLTSMTLQIVIAAKNNIIAIQEAVTAIPLTRLCLHRLSSYMECRIIQFVLHKASYVIFYDSELRVRQGPTSDTSLAANKLVGRQFQYYNV
jgi:hypothetical protein